MTLFEILQQGKECKAKRKDSTIFSEVKVGWLETHNPHGGWKILVWGVCSKTCNMAGDDWEIVEYL